MAASEVSTFENIPFLRISVVVQGTHMSKESLEYVHGERMFGEVLGIL